jgi:glycogen operon protein
VSNHWHSVEGAPYPFGPSWIESENAYNFAIYSKHATGVLLLVYSKEDLVNPVYSYRMVYPANKTGRIWHCRVPASAIRGGSFYAYVIEGPFEPTSGHRFDPNKILIDPYVKVVFFPKDFSRDAAMRPGSNAGRAPVGLLPPRDGLFDWNDDRRPEHTHDTVIYELHVKGFTNSPSSGVSPDKRGTYAGLIERIPYLKELGVTVVELMPVQQYDPNEGNYWGYMPLSLFAPHTGYCSVGIDTVLNEFKEMVKSLHAAGIEVILDVIYNHTTELGESGPTYSFRGIDNSTYYLLEEDRARYRNDCGTGNVLHCGNRYVRTMILDSLRFWVREMHVDGFRFDLASIFTRDNEGLINLSDPPIISEITSDPDFSGIRLIAEAWDLATYQLGRSFPGVTWLQWNGRFRDDVRSFIRGDEGKVSAVVSRIYGSDDLFPDHVTHAYHAYQSVNFVASHDGFTLYDLVSYNFKHNESNGQNNADGIENNLSWNCGWEGDDGAPSEVLALRNRQIKNYCCMVFLANGTPMMTAGDEFMRTQRGNNNPYNQDNETSWIDWQLLEKNRDIFRFFQKMIAFRKAHPSLCRSRFWRDDICWHGSRMQIDQSPTSHEVAYFLKGRSQKDVDLYVMINSGSNDVTFGIPSEHAGAWRCVVDTSLPTPDDIVDQGSEPLLDSAEYVVKSRSIVVLMNPVAP